MPARCQTIFRSCGRLVKAGAAAIFLLFASADGRAENPSLDELLSGIVGIKAFITPDGRTVENLGRERTGSGIVIDNEGLILTIGYLMVEAHSAEIITNEGRVVAANVIGYDHDSGFGLLRAIQPLKLRPLPLGKSADLREGDKVLAASVGGVGGVAPAIVISRREFVGSWEYLIDGAIFTAPAHTEWSGAALINRDGKLVGVGSLIVGDVTGKKDGVNGNMYVPIDLLPPILADLLAAGRTTTPPRPWLGVTTAEASGKLVVSRVTPGGPAAKAGVQRGDVIAGVKGQPITTMADFYRKVWAQGKAGITVPLDIGEGSAKRTVDIESADRLDHLKLRTTF
jgi:S1-C subfamily serine protease